MPPPGPPVLIAGAGIGGLTAALAIARTGCEVVVFDQAERLDEIGAGIQLSPNASRVLIALGLGDALRRHVVAPDELRIMNAASARVLVRAPLGTALAQRYGAPYWIIHRADLQAVLLDAVRADARITLRLGARVDDFASHPGGVTITTTSGQLASHQRGRALIAADGLWSTLRRRLGHRDEPSFAGHSAWRALAPTAGLPPAIAAAAVNLWFGPDAHLVHYPIRRGELINVVAIVRDDWHDSGWGAPAAREDVLARFPPANWPPAARTVLAAPPTWQKWALYDRLPTAHWGDGPVTLLGDAAHPMLPYLAQGAAMAIEDAAVLARQLAQTPADPAGAMRRYERERRSRTARAQRTARRNGTVYHMSGASALVRSLALLALGGGGLIGRHDWLYRWKPA